MALYNPQQHRSLAFRYSQDPGVGCRLLCRACLWFLGYPDQALEHMQEALTLAQELSHPFSLAICAGSCCLAPSVPPGGAAGPGAGRGRHGALYASRGLRSAWPWNDHAWLGTGGAGTGEQRAWPRCARAWPPAGHGGRCGLAILTMPCWPRRTGQSGRRGRAARAGRGAGDSGQQGKRLWEARAVSAQRGAAPDGSAFPTRQQAETCFHQALDIARRQEAKSLELRAP